jgi:gluconolactonase
MLKPGATSLVNVGMVGGPNGIRLSPDEKTLYVNGFGAGTISAFDVADDGTATKRSAQFASGLSNPDSMCLDAAGNLYVGVSSGLQVFRPNGEKVKLVRVDVSAGECTISGVTNCGFGGEDGKTLFITTWKTVVKIDNMPIPGLDWKIGKQRAVCN